MRLWAVLPDEPLTDDRAYLLGHLNTVFTQVTVSRAARTADRVTEPERRPDVILNLVSARSRALLHDIDAKGRRYGVPVSPPSEGSWRTEDKRTYLVDYPDISPPTRVARSIDEVQAARAEFGGDVVVKDPFSDRGRGVERISNDADMSIAEQLLENTICGTRQLVVQPYLSGFTRGDKRVILQRSPQNSLNVIAYIMRKPPKGGWKSNIRSGGTSLPTELTDDEIEVAQLVAKKANVDNVGVDIGEHQGRLYYIEHNQGYGGIIDFDLQRGACCVKHCGDFLLYLARHGRPDA